MQRIDSCSCWVSYKDKILSLQNENKILKKDSETKTDRNVSLHQQLAEAVEIIGDLLPCASHHIFNNLPRLDEEMELYYKADKFVNKYRSNL